MFKVGNYLKAKYASCIVKVLETPINGHFKADLIEKGNSEYNFDDANIQENWQANPKLWERVNGYNTELYKILNGDNDAKK